MKNTNNDDIIKQLLLRELGVRYPGSSPREV